MTSEGFNEVLARFRAANVPLYNRQPLKLGLFATNLSGHVLCSAVPSTFEVTWPHSLTLARQADAMGFEVLIPAARWLGYGGKTDLHSRTFETLTYAAGLLASTKNIMVFSTIHASVNNPVIAAKAITTLDHISNGRAGLNVVMGWYAKEMAMLGVELRDHVNRYTYGAEWIDIVQRLWTDNQPFNFEGQYFHLEGARSDPKPIQPRPVIANAGASPAGMAFSARHADFNFTIFDTEDDAQQYVSKIRNQAWNDHRRTIGMLTTCVVVCRDTEAEAIAAHRAIVNHGDLAAAQIYIASQGIDLDSFPKPQRDAFMDKFFAGAASTPIVGTPAQVVEQFASIKNAGIDGVLIGLVDYVEELPYFEARVMPLLKQRGLRV